MHFVPPPSPNVPSGELARLFIDNKDRIRIGFLIQCVCWGFYYTWGVATTLLIRKMEGGFPS
jgi:hypothetical protein